MLTFLATILSTVCIYMLFAGFKRWGIRTAWAITINYFVAAGLGWTMAGGTEAMVAAWQAPWILPLACIGALFYPLFRLTATCSQELGVSVASIATKLSMAIPVLALALADGIHGIACGQWLGRHLDRCTSYLFGGRRNPHWSRRPRWRRHVRRAAAGSFLAAIMPLRPSSNG